MAGMVRARCGAGPHYSGALRSLYSAPPLPRGVGQIFREVGVFHRESHIFDPLTPNIGHNMGQMAFRDVQYMSLSNFIGASGRLG